MRKREGKEKQQRPTRSRAEADPPLSALGLPRARLCEYARPAMRAWDGGRLVVLPHPPPSRALVVALPLFSLFSFFFSEGAWARARFFASAPRRSPKESARRHAARVLGALLSLSCCSPSPPLTASSANSGGGARCVW